MKNATTKTARGGWTVLYYVGGTERGSWSRTVPVETLGEAEALRERIDRQGYRTLRPMSYALSMECGLPVEIRDQQ